MKQLSINHISAASIRANRKTYLSLAVGIVLAVLLATVMTLCAFGLIKALERKAVQIVGWTDCILLDEPDITDESLRQSGLFDRIGHQFVAASVTDSNVYLGWLDEAGQDVLCRAPAEGRMPEQRGEIAIERSALERLRLESEIGDTVTWTLLPLRRASRQMPMGVLRDTALLRKAGSFKSKSSFHATKLIAVRQLRIHPWRQIGAALLVSATLLCAAIIGEQSYDVVDDLTPSRPVAFSLTNQKATFSNVPFSVVRPENQLSEQDVAQVRSLPLVDYANLEAETKVNMLLYGEVPDYFLPFTGRTLGQGTDGENTWVYNIFGGGSGLNYLSFSPDDPEPPILDRDAGTTERQQSWAWEQYRQMRALMEAQGLAGKPVPFTLYITDLSRVDYTDRIAEGKVDLAAIDAGQQVLVYAPTYRLFRLEEGVLIAAASDAWGRAASEAEFENDFFHAGQTLELVQLVQEHLFDDMSDGALRSQFAQMTRHDAAVTVGAVLNGKPIRNSEVCILTTEAGAKALGFEMTEITGMEISLTQDVDRETEQALEKRLERIAMRGEMTVFNWLQSWREQAASSRAGMLLVVSILLLFFTVSVAMQVGNAGRRIRADERMIGTLRAVGADEKALLGCYRLPLLLTTGIGAALGSGTYLAVAIWYQVQTTMHMHTIPVLAAMLILAALCALCCLAGLRMRLKSVLDQSIVENIREL